MSEKRRGLVELHTISTKAAAESGSVALAFVGAGGKTSSIFALAASLAAGGSRVLVTTTTRMLNPDSGSEREGKGFGTVLELDNPLSLRNLDRLRRAGPCVVLGSIGGKKGKLVGIDPEALLPIASIFDFVLVEADGARGLSIKAPASHEPVIPGVCALVVGIVALDALGAPMNGRVVHRPEILGPLVGCAPGEPISILHVARLASSPLGLFKGAPRGASRIVLLNKADAVAPELAADCAAALLASGAADAVVIGALGAAPGGAAQ